MSSMIDSLFDQYERGKLTRRSLVQALAALALPAAIPFRTPAQTPAPASAPLVKAYGVNHIGLSVANVDKSFAFYQQLFGVTKGWPATDSGTPGFHLDLPDGYISVDTPASGKTGVFTHFSIATDPFDMEAGRRMADKINAGMPGVTAKALFQKNDGVTTVNLIDPDGLHVQISPKTGR